MLQQLKPAGSRHYQVQQDEVRFLSVQEVEYVIRVAGPDRRVAGLRECLPNVPKHQGLVIDCENPRALAQSRNRLDLGGVLSLSC